MTALVSSSWLEHSPEMHMLRSVESIYAETQRAFADPGQRIQIFSEAQNDLEKVKLGLKIFLMSRNYENIRMLSSQAAILQGCAAFEAVVKTLSLFLPSKNTRGAADSLIQPDPGPRLSKLEKLARNFEYCGVIEIWKTPDWERVKSFSRIRNMIAHDGGILDPKAKTEVSRLIGQDSFLTIMYDDHGHDYLIEFKASFVDEHFKVYRRFVENLVKETNEKLGPC